MSAGSEASHCENKPIKLLNENVFFKKNKPSAVLMVVHKVYEAAALIAWGWCLVQPSDLQADFNLRWK